MPEYNASYAKSNFGYFSKAAYADYPSPILVYIFFVGKTPRIFWLSLLVSLCAMLLFLSLRGFGWDGDSLVNVSQFNRVLSHHYGMDDAGTYPKLGCMVLFGVFYDFVPGGFYTLTFLCIALNALAIACLCAWVTDLSGFWLIPLCAILLNVAWLGIVCSCDNPAFSIPLTLIALYLYFHRQRTGAGIWLAFAAGLFRPGAEFVLAFMIAAELWRHRRISWLACSLLALGLLHTAFGYRMVYASQEQFVRLAILYGPYTADPQYLHSPRVVIPFLHSVEALLQTITVLPLLLLALVGILRAFQQRLSIAWLLAALAPSLLLVVSAAKFGSVHTIEPAKMMEFTFVLPVMAGICLLRLPPPVWLKQTAAVLILCGLLVQSARAGKLHHGDFEAGPNGGQLEFRELVVEGKAVPIASHAINPTH